MLDTNTKERFVKCKFRHKHKSNIPLHAVVKDGKLVLASMPKPFCYQATTVNGEKYSVTARIGTTHREKKEYREAAIKRTGNDPTPP